MRFRAFLFSLSALAGAGFAQEVMPQEKIPPEENPAYACADSSFYDSDAGFWLDAPWEEGEGDPCDAEASLLFSGVPPAASSGRNRNRASFAVARNARGEGISTLRQESQTGAWSQRLEVREDTLTRRRFGWSGRDPLHRWKLVAGDLDDPTLSLWPAGFPRRTLPGGWYAARRTLRGGSAFSSSHPQGVAAEVLQPGWKAWVARVWNPVETGQEPPWSPVWNLHHVSTGISLSLPWTFTAQLTDTRIRRAETDSVAEQTVAVGLASPLENWSATAALSKSERTRQGEPGWALATAWRHRFANTSSLEVAARQRAAAWEASWDPAVKPEEARAAARAGEAIGAGEFRVTGHLPFPLREEGGSDFLPERERARAGVDLETWGMWNPPSGTAREGVRGGVRWNGEGARVFVTGTHRRARAASGSVSVYRYLEAETRLEENPHFRFSAFRAWNRSGPARTGFFGGMEPAWGTLRASCGLKVESNADDALFARGSLGARWGFARGWDLDAAAAAPCYPRWEEGKTRWRVTIHYAARDP